MEVKNVNRQSKGRKIVAVVIIVAALLIVAYLLGYLIVGRTINKSAALEAGVDKLTISLFDNSEKASFKGEISEDMAKKPGEYKLKLKKYVYVFNVALKVLDTEPPKGTAVNHVLWKGEELKAEDFVTDIIDNTEVALSFKVQPDFQKVGQQAVVVVLKDEGGNTQEITSELTINEDLEPPVIAGVMNHSVYVGETLAYRKGVTVTDNRDEKVELTIDSSGVDLSKVGEYKATYSAIDSSGNKATKTITVTVVEKSVSEDTVYALADKVLANIIKGDMTAKQKAEAIYKWVRGGFQYRGQPASGDWLKSAYEGLTRKSGDCYVYYAVSRALLTRVGIDNIEIVRTDGGHYWNMVNYGTGWYHFDTCPRRTGGTFCLLTDAEIEAYSAKYNSHYWDKSLYPATPLE